MTRQPSPSLPRRVRPVVGTISTWVGIGLIGVICVYLGLVSWLTEAFRRWLGTTETGLYSHPILVVLGAMMLVSLAAATVIRIPLRLSRAGAWASHLGVLVLAGGSAWYVFAKVGGHTATFWTPAGWTPIRWMYLKDTYAVYLWSEGRDDAVETILPIHLAVSDQPQALDVPLAGAGRGAAIRAVGYHPQVRITEETWRNNSPAEAPAVTLELGQGRHAAQITLSQGQRPRAFLRMEEYLLYYHSSPPPDAIARLRELAAAAQDKGRTFTPVVISGAKAPLQCMALGPDGPTWKGELPAGQLVAVPLGRRSLALRLIRTLSHAARHYQIAPVHPSVTPKPGGSVLRAVHVKVSSGSGSRMLWVPYDECQVSTDPVVVDLGGGRKVRLRFSRVRKPLPGTVQMHTAEYLTHPGMRSPRDYRSEVSIAAGGTTRDEVLNLNNPIMVGPYQLIQSNWQFFQAQSTEASHIFLEVRNRPGLWLIWVGCWLICLGFLYAFYVKPLLVRHRRARP